MCEECYPYAREYDETTFGDFPRTYPDDQREIVAEYGEGEVVHAPIFSLKPTLGWDSPMTYYANRIFCDKCYFQYCSYTCVSPEQHKSVKCVTNRYI